MGLVSMLLGQILLVCIVSNSLAAPQVAAPAAVAPEAAVAADPDVAPAVGDPATAPVAAVDPAAAPAVAPVAADPAAAAGVAGASPVAATDSAAAAAVNNELAPIGAVAADPSVAAGSSGAAVASVKSLTGNCTCVPVAQDGNNTISATATGTVSVNPVGDQQCTCPPGFQPDSGCFN